MDGQDLDIASDITRAELVAALREMQHCASDYVRAYATLQTPNVTAADLDAIVGALGTISIPEAIRALDRIERGEP